MSYQSDTHFSEPYIEVHELAHSTLVLPKLIDSVSIEAYTEYLRRHPRYLEQFGTIEEKRIGVSIARQTVLSIVEYVEKLAIDRSTQLELLDFLFTDNSENRLLLEYNLAIQFKDDARVGKIAKLESLAKELLAERTRLQSTKSELIKAGKTEEELTKETEETNRVKLRHREKLGKLNILKAAAKNFGGKAEYYKDLCTHLALAKPKAISDRLKYKNTEFTNKFIFLLRYYSKLIPAKSPNISLDKIFIGDGFSIDILSRDNAIEAIGAGVTTPCCLNLPATGTKFLTAILFDPNVSLAVLKDSNGKLVATALVINDGSSINLLHVDVSKDFFGDERTNAQENAAKRAKIKRAFGILSETLNRSTGLPVYLAPGEATLANFGVSIESLVEINGLLKNPKCWRTPVTEELVSASVKSGRTDVANYNWFAYALENSDKLTEVGKLFLTDFITPRLGGGFELDGTTVATIFNHLLEDDGGHGLCKLRFKSHSRVHTSSTAKDSKHVLL